jgi:hypothetical protein
MIAENSIGRRSCLLLAACIAIPVASLGDVLIGLNGERFVGKVVEEKGDSVVFDSETGGRLIVPRGRIREIQRTPVPQSGDTNQVQTGVKSTASVTNRAWQPPGLGKDGFDWIQLKSDEWLKGHLDYVKDKKVHFESEKLEEQSLELKDVRHLFSAKPMFTKFDGRDQVYGTVIISNNLVEVVGPEQLRLPRDQLTGITPGGNREVNFWSGKANIGVNLQAGNTKQTTLNASGELARRTPNTQFLIDYLGNYGEVDGAQNANNHRVNLSYDIRLNRDWFVRPVHLEYYRDQLANIAHRATAGVGFGYYLFDRDTLEWKVSAGPGYQYTRFETVALGESESASTPAGILQSEFEADITSRLTFIQTFAGTLASQEAGLYSHHLVTTFEFEIKHSLDLNVSLVWDYLQNPQTEASGAVPKHGDLRLALGIGVKF